MFITVDRLISEGGTSRKLGLHAFHRGLGQVRTMNYRHDDRPVWYIISQKTALHFEVCFQFSCICKKKRTLASLQS